MRREDTTAGLAVENRAAAPDEASVETRVLDAIRSVRAGESRSLTTAAGSAGPITPAELAVYLWDRLRPASIGLASGVRVNPTSRDKVAWPQLVSDVDPSWVAEPEVVPAGDPGFATLEAEPKDLAHRITEISNRVIETRVRLPGSNRQPTYWPVPAGKVRATTRRPL